jgi:hypothetical protein
MSRVPPESAFNVIPVAVVDTTVPVTVVPSRRVTVACGIFALLDDSVFVHAAKAITDTKVKR